MSLSSWEVGSNRVVYPKWVMELLRDPAEAKSQQQKDTMQRIEEEEEYCHRIKVQCGEHEANGRHSSFSYNNQASYLSNRYVNHLGVSEVRGRLIQHRVLSARTRFQFNSIQICGPLHPVTCPIEARSIIFPKRNTALTSLPAEEESIS